MFTSFDQVFLDQHIGENLKFETINFSTHSGNDERLNEIASNASAISVCITRQSNVVFYHVAYVPK
jgi:hypothetical protein